ncbi:MAG: NapC/NirT family cytochrome c [Magnetococcales bacterium]|nr:NapC/NirT family cytochrome c [Magnetococcales bacterium]
MSLFGKIRTWATTPSSKPAALFLGYGLTLGVLFFLGFHFIFMKGTNSTELCISCHEMEGVYQEYKKSVHYKNNSGVRTQCADCHIPHGDDFLDYYDKFMDKVIVGTRHLYHHVIGTYPDRQSFEKSRYRLAQDVLQHMRDRDSKECRQCHSYEAMALLDQGKSASRKHTRVMNKGGKTCIDCHSGIAHEEQEEPDEEDEEDEEKAS